MILTVLVPCYNYAHYLPACLDSVLVEKEVPLKVIVLDDCSPDNTAEVAEAYARKDARVSLVRNEQNLGNIATYNKGIAMVETPYMTILSADDMVTPGAYARAMDVFLREPSVGLVYGAHICIDEHGMKRFGWRRGRPVKLKLDAPRYTKFTGREYQDIMCRTGKVFLIGSEAVTRTAAQVPYEPRLPHSGDVEMWLRIAHQWEVAYLPSDQLLYRVHSRSMQMTVHHGFEKDLELRRRAFQVAFGKSALDTKQLVTAEQAIDRLLAEGERGSLYEHLIGHRLRHRQLRRTGVSA